MFHGLALTFTWINYTTTNILAARASLLLILPIIKNIFLDWIVKMNSRWFFSFSGNGCSGQRRKKI